MSSASDMFEDVIEGHRARLPSRSIRLACRLSLPANHDRAARDIEIDAGDPEAWSFSLDGAKT